MWCRKRFCTFFCPLLHGENLSRVEVHPCSRVNFSERLRKKQFQVCYSNVWGISPKKLPLMGQIVPSLKLFCSCNVWGVLFLDRRSVAQQYWIDLHSSSNIVGPRTRQDGFRIQVNKVLYGLYARCTEGGIGCIRLHSTPLPTRTQ